MCPRVPLGWPMGKLPASCKQFHRHSCHTGKSSLSSRGFGRFPFLRSQASGSSRLRRWCDVAVVFTQRTGLLTGQIRNPLLPYISKYFLFLIHTISNVGIINRIRTLYETIQICIIQIGLGVFDTVQYQPHFTDEKRLQGVASSP